MSRADYPLSGRRQYSTRAVFLACGLGLPTWAPLEDLVPTVAFRKLHYRTLTNQRDGIVIRSAIGDRVPADLEAPVQQISDRAAEGRPRLAALDDTLDHMETRRLALAKETAAFDTSGPDMTARIEELRRRHNPDETELPMHQFILMARKGDNEDAKRQSMPIIRHLIQKVVIGKTPAHPPATLQVHGLIACILAQMDVLTFMERRFIAEVHADFMERLEAGEIDTKQKQKKLLDAYAEELRCEYPQWANLQLSLVVCAGFGLSFGP